MLVLEGDTYCSRTLGLLCPPSVEVPPQRAQPPPPPLLGSAPRARRYASPHFPLAPPSPVERLGRPWVRIHPRKHKRTHAHAHAHAHAHTHTVGI